MMHVMKKLRWMCLISFGLYLFHPVTSFAPQSTSLPVMVKHRSFLTAAGPTSKIIRPEFPKRSIKLYSSSNDELPISESDQGVVGVIGSLASLVVLYSEYTLKKTGCGLPAGPLGLVGLVEGLSYLTVVGIVGLSLFTKVKTGSGLPSGPGGLLGAAEGLSYLAALAGVVALVLQVTNYGYIPNAIPMEGGMCS